MWMTELPPFVPFFLAALILPLTRGALRNAIILVVPVLGGLHLWFDVPAGVLVGVS